MSPSALPFLLAFVAVVQSRPQGPPVVNDVCVNLIPAAGAPHRPQKGHYGYRIETNLALNATSNMYQYTAGQQYTGKDKLLGKR